MSKERNFLYKCKLFYCPEQKAYTCCSCCERKESCDGRCRNVPEKCGYSSARITDSFVECPFFGWTSYRNPNERKRLTCEGILEGTNDITEFGSERAKTSHMLHFCCADYISCKKAAELMRQYENGERSEKSGGADLESYDRNVL